MLRQKREVAMTTGNRDSAAMLAYYMCWIFASSSAEDVRGITPKMSVSQLEPEFAFDGLRDTVLQMQVLQKIDHLRRPCVLAGVSTFAL